MLAQASLAELEHHLRDAGWLPVECAVDFAAILRDHNLLTVLLKIVSSGQARDGKSRRLQCWMESAAARGAELRLWRDELSPTPSLRLLWIPRAAPAMPSITILSSHLGHRPYELRGWFRVLRELLTQASEQDLFVVAGNITARPWIEYAINSKRFHSKFSLLSVQCPSPRTEQRGMGEWLKCLPRLREPVVDARRYSAMLSPSVDRLNDTEATQALHREQSTLGDRFALQFADAVYLLRLTNPGRLASLIQRLRWRLPSTAQRKFRVVLGQELGRESTVERLAATGTVWQPVQRTNGGRRLLVKNFTSRNSPPPPEEPVWLTHWTRDVRGAWPDQSESEFRDDLLWDRPGADHSALAALMRMVAMRRLCASTSGIRGAFPVVCFTALPLSHISQDRIYRLHRNRWDQGGYGIRISRDWLEKRGTRPVIYGDSATWNALTPADEPFFQVAISLATGIDWRREEEWRVLGDVDLRELPSDQGCLFVPTDIEARWLQYLSRWPVYVIPTTGPELSRL